MSGNNTEITERDEKYERLIERLTILEKENKKLETLLSTQSTPAIPLASQPTAVSFTGALPTTTKFMSCSWNISCINLMNVAGALHKPKGNTNHSNRPQGVIKAVLWISSECILI